MEVAIQPLGPGCYFRAATTPGDAASPDALAATCPEWRADIQALGPWEEIAPPASGSGTREEQWWQSTTVTPETPLILTGPCSSSLDLAQEFARTIGLPDWASVLPTSQWAGRGQMGRAWSSPPGNIYAAWRLPDPPRPWKGFLSLLIGHALREALRRRGLNLQLKWPNDLWLGRRKLGGILVVEKAGVFHAGIGLNVTRRPPDAELRAGRAAAATSLAEAGVEAQPVGLWRELADAARAVWVRELEADTPANLAERMQEHLAFRGDEAILAGSDGEMRRVRVLGLGACGGLRVIREGREERVYSGSLLPAPP